MGRKLLKRQCPKCKRMVSIMSNVTRNKLRDHKCETADQRFAADPCGHPLHPVILLGGRSCCQERGLAPTEAPVG